MVRQQDVLLLRHDRDDASEMGPKAAKPKAPPFAMALDDHSDGSPLDFLEARPLNVCDNRAVRRGTSTAWL